MRLVKHNYQVSQYFVLLFISLCYFPNIYGQDVSRNIIKPITNAVLLKQEEKASFIGFDLFTEITSEQLKLNRNVLSNRLMRV